MTRTPEARTLDAIARARAERHQARLSANGRGFAVKSHTRPGVTYLVRVHATDDVVSFGCDHSQYDDDSSRHPERPTTYGLVPCKHGARAALRLARHGFLRLEGGRWVPTARAFRFGLAVRGPDDPFAGLPGCGK